MTPVNARSPDKVGPWMSKAWQGLRETASHPLVLLVVGAIISSYLIPNVTRKWQDHQHELELKTSLTGQISESSTRALLQMQARQLTSETQKQAYADILDWEIRSGVIEAELEAYFLKTSIGQEWKNVMELVHETNSLSFPPPYPYPQYRVDLIKNLRSHLRADQIRLHARQSNIDWRSLMTFSPDQTKYLTNWIKIRSQVQDLIDVIIRTIISTSIVGF